MRGRGYVLAEDKNMTGIRTTHNTAHKRRNITKTKVVASIAIVAATGAALVGGVIATFTETANAGPQSIASGTIVLAIGPTNDATTAATNIAAGDTVSREVDLNSTSASI